MKSNIKYISIVILSLSIVFGAMFAQCKKIWQDSIIEQLKRGKAPSNTPTLYRNNKEGESLALVADWVL